jgi:hypothetical protein
LAAGVGRAMRSSGMAEARMKQIDALSREFRDQLNYDGKITRED